MKRKRLDLNFILFLRGTFKRLYLLQMQFNRHSTGDLLNGLDQLAQGKRFRQENRVRNASVLIRE